MNFKPGDKAKVIPAQGVCFGDQAALWIGRVVTIVGLQEPDPRESWEDICELPWPVEFNGQREWFITRCLEKIDLVPPQQEPKQQREPTWDDIQRLTQWRPASVTEEVA